MNILIVDNYPPFARGLARLFALRGHTATLAFSIADALSFADKVDGVVISLVLEDGSGFDLAKRLRASHPDLRISLMSGLPDTGKNKEAVALGVPLLDKIEADQIVRSVAPVSA